MELFQMKNNLCFTCSKTHLKVENSLFAGFSIFKSFVAVGSFVLMSGVLSSCEGAFEGVYDDPDKEVSIKKGQLVVDATDWQTWHYIDLLEADAAQQKEGKGYSAIEIKIPTERLEASVDEEHSQHEERAGIYTYWYDVFGEGLSKREIRQFVPTKNQDEPASWHLAVHRNNVRTNGGAVYMTAYTSMDDLPESSEAFGEVAFTEDEWNETDVWTVQEKMLQGLIGNQGIKVNFLLSSWLKVSLPPVPPTFTLNNHVFILKLKDGTFAALQLVNYQNAAGVKCHLTINYKYPY